MILDPDYARIFTQARVIAWNYGYTCAAIGSYTRDLDLLLVPWTEQATANHDQLLKLIAQSCGLRFRDGQEDILKAKPDFTQKPHGRVSCSLFFPGAYDRRWVDIGIMPCGVKTDRGGNDGGTPMPDDRLYVTCHQCDSCGHIGINDEHPTESTCNRGLCGWHGPSPTEDVCPGCGEHGTMSTTCPECGGHYVLLADAHLPLPSGVSVLHHQSKPPSGVDAPSQGGTQEGEG